MNASDHANSTTIAGDYDVFDGGGERNAGHNATWSKENMDEWYYTLMKVQWVENWMNIVFSIYFIRRISRTALIHPNLKVLLIWSFIMPFMCFMMACMLHQANTSELADRLKPRLVTNLLCLLARFVHNTASPPMSLLIPFLAIERLMATIFISTYEKFDNRICVVLNVVMYGASAISTLVMMVIDLWDFDFRHSKLSCHSDEIRPTYNLHMWIFAAGCGNVGTVMIILLHKWNLRMLARARDADLPTRYQYNENIATMRAFVPAIVPFGVLVMIGASMAVYILRYHHYDVRRRTSSVTLRLYFEVMRLIVDTYATGFKLLFLCQFPPLRYQIMRDLSRLNCSARRRGISDRTVSPYISAPVAFEARATAKDVTNTYFAQLENTWSGPTNGVRPTKRNILL